MNQWIENVAEFHQIFAPNPVGKETRAKLIHEENLETITAMGFFVNSRQEIVQNRLDRKESFNLVETMDGICDSIYVMIGAALEFAGKEKLERCFAEVQRSNMSKLWTVEEWGEAIGSGRKEKDGLSARDIDHEQMIQMNGFSTAKCSLKRLVVTRPDMKVIKSPSYSPADLKPILEAH